MRKCSHIFPFYRNRFRTLQFNLSRPDRVVIHQRIISGGLSTKEISVMSSTDLTDEDTKQSIKLAEKEALEHSILQKQMVPRLKMDEATSPCGFRAREGAAGRGVKGRETLGRRLMQATRQRIASVQQQASFTQTANFMSSIPEPELNLGIIHIRMRLMLVLSLEMRRSWDLTIDSRYSTVNKNQTFFMSSVELASKKTI